MPAGDLDALPGDFDFDALLGVLPVDFLAERLGLLEGVRR